MSLTNSEIVLASLNQLTNVPLITWKLTFPRIILAEVNTHRTFCLAGDSLLEFDLPGGASKKSKSGKSTKRVFYMPIKEFVHKWHNGAAPRSSSYRVKNNFLNLVDDDKVYTGEELAETLQINSPSNIHKACRNGDLKAKKQDKPLRAWLIKGSEYKAYRVRQAASLNQYSMKKRLAKMKIRQLDESTGLITTSTVNDCTFSGVKAVYEVEAGDYSIKGSANHLLMTSEGYKMISELIPGKTQLLVRRMGKKDEDYLDQNRHRNFNGVWRSRWQDSIRPALLIKHGGCAECGTQEKLEVHHVEPVHVNPDRAFDKTNVTLLCQSCHKAQHKTQGWQSGMYLYADSVTVSSITYKGEEETYDLSISGDYPNFVANGLISHNSRNTSSSRAVPVYKMIQRARNQRFVPEVWGKNQKGMSAAEVLLPQDALAAEVIWNSAAEQAIALAEQLNALAVHKQLVNRLLEPFQYVEMVVSSTEWENWFNLRDHPAAQPEIAELARNMREKYDHLIDNEVYDFNGQICEMQYLKPGEWHTPFILDDERDLLLDERVFISAARCARVSYFLPDEHVAIGANQLSTITRDLELFTKLVKSKHLSPLEHVATPLPTVGFSANFDSWFQLRRVAENNLKSYQNIPSPLLDLVI